MRQMHIYLDENLKKAKTDADVIKAINDAFDKVENEWYEVVKTCFDKGLPKTAYVGSCALIAVVHNNKLFVANAGDSKAAVLRKKQDGSYESIKLSKTFNANKKYEQERLKEQFKTEPDIVICKDALENKACYVKGNLMPTRALGDFRLKKAEFNNHSYSRDLGYRNAIPVYNGPYITHVPDI
jgi:pyruvate dehydrogenase phosphatase